MVGFEKLRRVISSLNAIVAQSKNCPFGADTTIELKNTTKAGSNGI